MINEEELIKAFELSRSNFNSLPFETREKLASPYERLLEVEIAIDMAKQHLEKLKRRKRELNQWLLDWYHKQNKEQQL